MCGIAGHVDFTVDLSLEEPTLRAMTDTMACRGPDGSGVWLSPRAMLGHRRLAVVDVLGGHQPMAAGDPGDPLAVISYCSEVYNHRRLRAELETAGHHFRTDCDTEVVLRAYLEWGEAFAARLDGIFGFAIWDVRRERLLLVRDRFGVKPLFYARTATGIVFGSEPKALLAHPEVEPVVDTDGLRELLSVAKTPGHGIYRGVREVCAGELVTVDRCGLRRRPYWRLDAGEHRDGLRETVATVRGLLEEAVERQLACDVPLCAFLSGGLDSSVVTAIAARSMAARGAGPLRTFAVDFAGYVDNFRPDFMRDAPDAPYAHAMARHARTLHSDVVLTTAELADAGHRETALRALDLPSGRGDRDTSLYLLCRAAASSSTVALTGESADEVFGGYPFFRNGQAHPAADFPWLPMFGHPADDGSGSASSLLDPGLLGKLDLPGYRAAAYHDAIAEVPYRCGDRGLERRMRQISYLALTRLLRILLDRAERMSMAAPIEMRIPFLDHRLVEYVFSVPWAMKAFDGREKSLLRAAAADLVPPEILHRRKAPFPAVQDPRYEGALRRELADLLHSNDAPVAPLLNTTRARRVADLPVGEASSNESRSTIELALRLNSWLDRYHIRLDLAG